MDPKIFLDAIAGVNTMWSMAAFAIAAILASMKAILASPAAARRRGRQAPAFLGSSLVWPVVVVICAVAALPILADTYLESRRIRQQGIYRARVTVLDPEGRPMSGATLRTTVSNETTVSAQGAGVVTIPAATLPADRKVTIFADVEAAFLHGSVDLQLGDDPNPSVTLALAASRDATVTGLVEDEAGRAIAGASVHVLGGESGRTSDIGTFVLKTNAAVGQSVRLHAEQPGYKAVDQDHPAGREPVTIVLTPDRP